MKKFIISMLAMFFAASVYSQTADFVTEILETPEARYGQVCYLTAVYLNLVPETASEADAANALFAKNIVNNNVKIESPVNYAQAAGILSKIWKIKGSLMFTVTKGSPRYAFKQLRNDKVIPSKKDPSDIPSGTDLLNMFTAGNIAYGD